MAKIKQDKQPKVFIISKYLKNYKGLIFWGPFFKAVEAATEVVIPLLMAIIIDDYILAENKAGIINIAIVILALNVVGIICAVIGQKFAAVTGESIGRDMRNDVFRHINTFSHAELDKFSTAALLNRAVFDVYHLQEGISLILRVVMRAPFLFIGSTIMAMTIDLKLSIVFLVVVPILMAVILFIMKKLTPLITFSKEQVDKTSLVTRENLSGVRVVRAFCKQESEIERFSKTNKGLHDIQIKEGKWSAALQPIIFMIVNLAVIVLIYFGSIEINLGTGMSQGHLIAFINYFAQISMALVLIARLITMFTRMKTSADRIEEVMQVENSIVNPKRPVKVSADEIKGEVSFCDVSFSYNGVNDIISHFNLNCPSGQTVGIIGPTGSGKSSITNLIPRFYDTTKGQVKIDGIDVRKFEIEFLRNLIGIVPQNPTLFEGTIRSNMCWRKPDATDAEIIFALKIAQAYDFVSEYPDFLDHKVNRGGTNFSGGQKQRLTIARAIVGNPKILILDDSSSALDFATDAKLRSAIAKNLKGVTTFIVSQRTNSIKNADQIVVLDGGNVVGIGKHADLLDGCEVYREIHLSQNKKGGING